VARQHAAELIKRLANSKEWPTRHDRKMLQELYLYAAIRESDAEYLQPDDWSVDEQGTYILDPLGARIPGVWEDMVFGEDPVITHSAQKQYDFLIEENDLAGEFQTAEGTCSSEGEVWWRAYINEDLSDAPIIDFHSRTTVYPLFKGRKIVAVAFISVITDGNEAWRYVECHAEEVVLNRLFKVPMSQPAGDETPRPSIPSSGRSFGDPVSLKDRDETADIEPNWEHGLKHMLCGRVINRRGRDRRRGVSDYQGKVGLLMALNDASNVGHDNLKLTGRKRAVINPEALQPQVVTMANGSQMTLPIPTFDSREQVFVRGGMDETLGSTDTAPFQVLEYSFDADALETYTNGLENRILTRSRIAPQLVGKATEDAATGPALRARLMDSVLAANGKGRFWDDEAPDMLRAAALVDNLSRSLKGFGRSYEAIDDLPEFKRSDPLPPDEQMELNNDIAEYEAGFISRKRVIARRNPEMDDEQVDELVEEIEDENAAAAPEMPPPPDEIPPEQQGAF
jgi:hypothetical protein